MRKLVQYFLLAAEEMTWPTGLCNQIRVQGNIASYHFRNCCTYSMESEL
jgi:hypothetical protein